MDNKIIVVTGAMGFIGSRIVKALNARGITNIVAVDDLEGSDKFRNLGGCVYEEYLDKREFLDWLSTKDSFRIEAIFHEGACTDTMVQDSRFMLEQNYDFTMRLLRVCREKGIRVIYASSAAVYGGTNFREVVADECPLNVYGFSKLLVDQQVRRLSLGSQVVGLRYFNVYGPAGEDYKGNMASIVHQFQKQLLETGKIKLFKGTGNTVNGEQQRDFVHVSDVVKVNLWMLDHPEVNGIFNVGTGKAMSFNQMAKSVIRKNLANTSKDAVEYIDPPESLRGRYQNYTQADLRRLRAVGYLEPFKSVAEALEIR